MSIHVKLLPYVHQVSGHANLMTTDDQTIIFKVLIQNELDFYRLMSPELRIFTPKFFGKFDVTQEYVSSNILYTAQLSSNIALLDAKIGRNDVRSTSSSLEQSGVEYEGLERDNFCKNGGFQSNRWTKDKDTKALPSSIGRNPWATRLQNQAIYKLNTNKKKITRSCLALENIAGKFIAPCILDLKVGTRLYGDDCPEDKIQRHHEKYDLSTTSSLGIRLTGYQVYQNSRYVCRNKFFGRGLSVDGFSDSLRTFLHDGTRVRTELINPILRMLEYLIDVIKTLDSYRLYGSSLIIVYEGADCDRTRQQHWMDGKSDNRIPNNDNLNVDQANRDTAFESKKLLSDDLSPSSNKINGVDIIKLRHSDFVDVRIVDFAHCTSRYLSNNEFQHEGPDSGFIFGLQNLIKLLTQINNCDGCKENHK